jgi:hypothetical protein
MGWNFSPLIAQCVGWMILLFHEPSEEPGYTLERSDEPPAFVRLKKGGILTLYYDNYVVITGDSAEAEFWNHRILRNCEKVAGDRGELCRLLSIEFGIMATSRGRKLVQTDRKVTGGPHRVYPFPGGHLTATYSADHRNANLRRTHEIGTSW